MVATRGGKEKTAVILVRSTLAGPPSPYSECAVSDKPVLAVCVYWFSAPDYRLHTLPRSGSGGCTGSQLVSLRCHEVVRAFLSLELCRLNAFSTRRYLVCLYDSPRKFSFFFVFSIPQVLFLCVCFLNSHAFLLGTALGNTLLAKCSFKLKCVHIIHRLTIFFFCKPSPYRQHSKRRGINTH